MMRVTVLLVSLAVAGSVGGCALGRGDIEVATPDYPGFGSEGAGRTVTITSVEDARVFEDRPPHPSTPSLKDPVAQVPESIRIIAIARKRSRYGLAQGDIVLEQGDVTTIIKDILESAFEAHGFDVTPGGITRVEASIEKFWAWMTPRIVVGSMEANIATEITVRYGGKRKRFSVTGYGRNVGLPGREENWVEAYRRCLLDYEQNLDEIFADLGYARKPGVAHRADRML